MKLILTLFFGRVACSPGFGEHGLRDRGLRRWSSPPVAKEQRVVIRTRTCRSKNMLAEAGQVCHSAGHPEVIGQPVREGGPLAANSKSTSSVERQNRPSSRCRKRGAYKRCGPEKPGRIPHHPLSSAIDADPQPTYFWSVTVWSMMRPLTLKATGWARPAIFKTNSSSNSPGSAGGVKARGTM